MATDTEIRNEINERFAMMDKLTDGLIDGTIKSITVSGAPGVGKTYELKNKLERAEDDDTISTFTMFSGKLSAVGLYQLLFLHSGEDNVLVIDDVDSVFKEDDALSYLLAALDDSSEYCVQCMTGSSAMRKKGLPTKFYFSGKLVLLTNSDFDRIIERNGSNVEHIKALMSRSIYLDLGIHSVDEVLVRIEHVLNNSDLLETKGCSANDKDMILEWLHSNKNRLRMISLREVGRIAEHIATDRDTWKTFAETTLIKRGGKK